MSGDRYTPQPRLMTGPVGCGKTEAAIDAILAEREQSPLGLIWVVLATQHQTHMVREQLVARSPGGVQFGVEFFSFGELYARLLDLAGDPQRQVSDTARYRILRHVIGDLARAGQLVLFAPIAHTPGFIGLVAGLLHELKQGMAYPDRFADVAATRGDKDRDLAHIYVAYQEFLQDKRLVDRHGAGWLALEHLRRDDRLGANVNLLVVDGFDQFSAVQRSVLAWLAGRIRRTVVTLTAVPGRRFRRFEQTRARLLASGAALDWQAIPLVDPGARAAPELEHLVSRLFRIRPDPPVDGTPRAVALVEAPDEGREVSAVLRCVKRRLLDGTSPEDMVIVARTLGRYAGPLRETARAYGVPLVVRAGGRLRENPAVAMLLALVDLAAQAFPRRGVLDTLHSPYLQPPDLTPAQIAALERISLERQVVRGKDVWLDAIRRAAAHPLDDEDHERATIELDAAPAAALAAALQAHFDRITPPARGPVADLVAWLVALIGPDPAAYDEDRAGGRTPARSADAGPAHFDMLERIRAGGDPDQAARDITAIQRVMRVLYSIQAASDLVAAGDIAWADFRAELELAIEQAEVTPVGGWSRRGRVLAIDARQARGLAHDHVYVLGLAEGEFPAPVREDALYHERERVELEAAGIDMQTAEERADDMSLFYQVVGLARRSLTLSRCYVDDSGAQVPPSPYWSAVQAALGIPAEAVQRFPVGAAPTFDEAATFSEAAVAVAESLRAGEDARDAALAVHNALLSDADWGPVWRAVLAGRALEARRADPFAPFDEYSGVLRDRALVAVAAGALGPDRVWSASQFTEYGTCPFRFFARRLLALEELEEPEEGLDALQRGLINHAVLEHTYRRIADEGLAITPDNQARALAILDEVADAVFAGAPDRYGFRPSPVWDYERAALRRRLRWLVALDFSDDTPLRLQPRQYESAHPVAAALGEAERWPFRQEAAYGFGDDAPPIKIEGPAGPVWARGKIDRMDQAGEHVVIIDYKSGSTPHSVRDMEAGRDFQMLLYLLAAQQLLKRENAPQEVLGGVFWHISNRALSGQVCADDDVVDEARDTLHAHVQAARAGDFRVQPRKLERGRCVSYCAFGPLCRMSRVYLQKDG